MMTEWLEESVVVNLRCYIYVTKRKNALASAVALTLVIVLIIFIITLSAIFTTKDSTPVVKNDITPAPIDTLSEFEKSLFTWINKDVKPCNDFYNYACGEKIGSNSSISQLPFVSIFVTLQELVFNRIKDFFDRNIIGGDSFNKARLTYVACMNINSTVGLLDIQNQIESLGGWPMLEGDEWQSEMKSMEDVFLWSANVSKLRLTNGLFGIAVGTDPHDTSSVIAKFTSPKISSVIGTDDGIEEKISKVVSTIYSTDPVSKEVKKLVKLITNLKKIEEEAKSQNQHFKRLTLEEIQVSYQIDFIPFLNNYFENIVKFQNNTEVLIYGASYFKNLMPVLNLTDIRTVIDFEILTTVLPAILEVPFKTNERSLFDSFPPPPIRLPRPGKGQPKELFTNLVKQVVDNENSRWTLCMTHAINWFKYTLAKKYSEHFLINHEREFTENVTAQLIEVFKEHIASLNWMDDSSRSKANLKLNKMKKIYAYPTWVDNPTLLEKYYANFPDPASHIENFFSANKFSRNIEIQQMNETYKKMHFDEVFFSPLEVNAYNDLQKNSINILAAIMQSPIFESTRKSIYNFAMLGTIVAHEITHGFDNTGQEFDENGNQKRWMTNKSMETFKNISDCFKKQYSDYRMTKDNFPYSGLPDGGLQINGEKTLGDNIADNGGIQQSYFAYKNWSNLPEDGQIIVNNFIENKLFFLTYAHLWCTKYSGTLEEYEGIKEAEHSPSMFRVIGSLSNFDKFSAAFGCQPSSQMFRGNKSCVLW